MTPTFNINESEKTRILGLYGLNGVNTIKEQSAPPKKVTVTVVDEEGNPLKGVRVTIIYKSYAEKLDWYRNTNKKGEFTYKLRDQKVKLLKFQLDGYRDKKQEPYKLLDKGNKVTLVKVSEAKRREEIMGCIDPKASNYEMGTWVDCKGNRTEAELIVYNDAREDGEEWVIADVDKNKADKSCCEYYEGCMDEKAENFWKKDPKLNNLPPVIFKANQLDKHTIKHFEKLGAKYTPNEDVIVQKEVRGCKKNKCCEYIVGCMDKEAKNYNPKATKDSGKCVSSNHFLEFVTVDWEIKGDLLSSLDNLVDVIVKCRFILHMLEFWYKSNEESCKDRSVKLSDIKGKLISGGVEDSLDDLEGLLGRLNKKTGLPNDVSNTVVGLLDEATSLYKKVDRRWNKIERIKRTGEPNVDRYMLKSIRRSLVKSYNDSEKAISIINGIKCP